MASTPSPRSPTQPFSDEESQETLRSKRSSIMIRCSDGSEVIFLRPHHPRSASYATVSTSHSPSPSSGPDSGSGPTSGPSFGRSEGSGPDDKKRKKGKRPVSMPAHPNVYDIDNRSGQSYRSLPTYLHERCSECGDLRGHSDLCSIGNRLFLASLEARRSAPADGIEQRTRHGLGSPRQRGISQPQPADVDHSRLTSGTTISRSPSSRHNETRQRGSPQRERSTDSRSPTHSQRAPNRTPSSQQQQGIQHSPGSPHRPPSRNSPNPLDLDRDSTFSSKARYSIDAVVGRSPSSRHDKIQLELRELSPQPSFPLRYFDANMRGGHGSGSCQAGGRDGSGSGHRDRPRSGGGTGRSRSRDVLLRGLRRCCFAFSWLFGRDAEISISSRRNTYDHARYEGRAQSHSHSRRTRRH
ncbi:hypothetical protein FHL15_007466 [Xylaria flabelliformis]|uniref:Uncharacterized protein n=1 Tax=Xylaria flabelliformis TaxID=2512241 RepID=A0A553HUR3_9PEZI|nr:hypothetical protein FHL15_007466 [Xylaria flabelliformis]